MNRSLLATAIFVGTLPALLATAAEPTPAPVPAPTPAPVAAPSFLTVVEPILTRTGCNQGMCHGKGAGQNGFRLSLRGYAPDWDHEWITREQFGRRIDPTVPEESLLLLKATAAAPHVGGRVLSRDSREYATLLAWLRAGAPGPDKAEPTLTGLSIDVATTPMSLGESRQLTVWAAFSDGSRRDVTWLTKFESNDAGQLEVSPTGAVTAKRPGETAVRAAYLDRVAARVLTVPFGSPDAPVAHALGSPANFVDEHVFAKLAALRIPASELASDAEFLRRAYLDTIGLPPSPAEARAFLSDARPDKRAQLVELLLARPEFNDFWALQLGDLLQNRRERDHDVRGAKGVAAFRDWIRAQVAANRPWDQLVRDVLTARGDSTTNPAVGYYIVTVGEHREAQRSEVVASVAQAFLGVRIGCAQCHNHPAERYTQDDYYHFAAYFSRMRLARQDPKKGPTTLEPLGEVAKMLGQKDKKGQPVKLPPIGVRQPRTGAFLAPQPLDRVATPIADDADPRVALAAWITNPANEYFSGNLVNRMVRHFLGVGLVEPVDDLRATNPPSNPELWSALNREFVGHGFDLRHLMRVLLNSRTYQLTSATRPGNAVETRFYSHYYARRLSAEVLADALSAATGVPDRFTGRPLGLRAVQLGDPKVDSYFLTLFGRSDRVTACACERGGDVSMAQLLHMHNGDSLVEKIAARDGRLTELLRRHSASEAGDAAVAEELFLATLARRPSEPELTALRAALADAASAVSSDAGRSADARAEVFRDLFWALLNSKEFAFNH